MFYFGLCGETNSAINVRLIVWLDYIEMDGELFEFLATVLAQGIINDTGHVTPPHALKMEIENRGPQLAPSP